MKAEVMTPEALNQKELLKVLTAFKRGDFSVRMPEDGVGLGGKISDTLNEVLELNENMCREFERIIRTTPWLIGALEIVRDLALPEGAIGAGAIRNCVWDHLHDYRVPTPLRDLDVVYFDRADQTEAAEARAEAWLRRRCPDIPWQVRNQARVWQWYQRKFGNAPAIINSVGEAVATWPEPAVAVAISLRRHRIEMPEQLVGAVEEVNSQALRCPNRSARTPGSRSFHTTPSVK